MKGDVAALCRAYLQPGDCAWDIGASDGVMTRVLLKAVGPTGTVVAVDADPRYQVAPHPQVTRHVCAIGPVHQPPLRLGVDRTHSSCYAVGKATGTTLTVPIMPLDALTPAPRLVKVDVQGAEGDVLDSGPTLLQTIRPVWVIECWPHGLTAAGTSALALVERFWAAGYQVLWPTKDLVTRDNLAAWLAALNRETQFVNLVAVP